MLCLLGLLGQSSAAGALPMHAQGHALWGCQSRNSPPAFELPPQPWGSEAPSESPFPFLEGEHFCNSTGPFSAVGAEVQLSLLHPFSAPFSPSWQCSHQGNWLDLWSTHFISLPRGYSWPCLKNTLSVQVKMCLSKSLSLGSFFLLRNSFLNFSLSRNEAAPSYLAWKFPHRITQVHHWETVLFF